MKRAELAISVDDLPAYGSLPLSTAKAAISAIQNQGVKGVCGFMNGQIVQKDPAAAEVLKVWVAAGNLLGNHTFSHLDLSKTSADEFIEDVKKNEAWVEKFRVKGGEKYFRYPCLSEGGPGSKRAQVRAFFEENDYRIVPVSVDFLDYLWNEPYVRCLEKGDTDAIAWLKQSYLRCAVEAVEAATILSQLVFGRPIKLILLSHLGVFQATMMSELLSAYRAAGVQLIGVPEAMGDPAYLVDPQTQVDYPYTFLHQMAQLRRLEIPPRVLEIQTGIPGRQLEFLKC